MTQNTHQSSPNYGKHLSFDEVGAVTSNSNATIAITNFLVAAGATLRSTTPHGEYMRFTAIIGTWERILPGAVFHHYNYIGKVKKNIGRLVRTRQYALPEALAAHDHVHFVAFTTHLPVIVPNAGPVPVTIDKSNWVSGLGAACNHTNWNNTCNYLNYTFPAFLKSHYNITNSTGSEMTSQGIAAFDDGFNPTDLSIFQEHFGLPQESVFNVSDSRGVVEACTVEKCAESSLDIQYMMSTSRLTPTTFNYRPSALTTVFFTFMEEVSRMVDPPKVWSISYGMLRRRALYPQSCKPCYVPEFYLHLISNPNHTPNISHFSPFAHHIRSSRDIL